MKEARSAADEKRDAAERARCERLLATLDAEAQPAIQVGAVPRRELAGAVGPERAAHLLKERVFLRVLVTTQAPADPAEVRLLSRLIATGTPVTLTPMGLERERLAELTRETLPGTTTTVTRSGTGRDEPGIVEEAASTAGGVVGGMLRVFTLGLLPPPKAVPRPDSSSLDAPTVVTVVPTEEDYAREAPATERLFELLKRRSALVFRRPTESLVSLRVRLSYKGVYPTESCTLSRVVEVAIPEIELPRAEGEVEGERASLEERIEKRFGTGTHSLAMTPAAEVKDAPVSSPGEGAEGDGNGARGQ